MSAALCPPLAFDGKGEFCALSNGARRYDARMEAFDPDFTIRRRKPRGRPARSAGQDGEGAEKKRDNYLAETPKSRAGAPLGNRHAVTHGAWSVDSRARRARLHALVKESENLAAAAHAVSDGVAQMRRDLVPPGKPQP